MKFTALVATMILLVGNNVVGQEKQRPIAERQTVGFMQEVVKYCFSKDLQVGDSVRYSMVDEDERLGDTQVTVIGKEKSGLWIREKAAPGNIDAYEIYYLIDPTKMTLLNITDDPEGSNAIKLLSSKEASLAFDTFVKSMKDVNTGMRSVKFGKSAKLTKMAVVAGTFKCDAYEVQEVGSSFGQSAWFPHLKDMKPKARLAILNQTCGTYFSKDVPRLIPMEILVNMIATADFPDILKQCQGGVVKNMQYQLIEYKRDRIAK